MSVKKADLLYQQPTTHLIYTSFVPSLREAGSIEETVPTPPVPEFIDLVFAKTSPKRSFSLNIKRAFWAGFRVNRVYKFGHRCRYSTEESGQLVLQSTRPEPVLSFLLLSRGWKGYSPCNLTTNKDGTSKIEDQNAFTVFSMTNSDDGNSKTITINLLFNRVPS